MKVLVIGGTGLVGPHVVDRLLSAGAQVALFNRRGMGPNTVTPIKGNRRDTASLRKAFLDFRPDVAIDMIPYTKEDAQGLVEASSGCTSSLIAVSSIDVYLAYGRLHKTEPGEPLLGPITELSPLRTKRSKEGRAYDKLGVEEVLSRSATVPVSIFRLPMIYGPPDTSRVGHYVKRMVDKRPLIPIGSSYAKWRVRRLFTQNCAEAISLCTLASPSRSAIYNVAEERSYAEREWIEVIGRVLDWRGEIIEVADQDLPPPFGIDTRQEMSIDSSRIRKDLGYHEIVDCSRAREVAVKWVRDEFLAGRINEPVDY